MCAALTALQLFLIERSDSCSKVFQNTYIGQARQAKDLLGSAVSHFFYHYIHMEMCAGIV